ncbi:MAG: ATP synthase F1 subunit delta [Clostridia bacterium]
MSRAADRYARVLFEVARERGVEEEVFRGLDYLVGLVKDVAEFRSIWLHPVLDVELKMQLLDPVLEVDPLVRDFLSLLVTRGRESHLESIRDAYDDIRLEARGVTRIQVYSAAPLQDEERREIGESLAVLGYEEVDIDEHRDRSLLGGVVVRIGDMKIDGSLRHRLHRMEEALSRNV